MNVFKLSRNWFDFCFENPEEMKPIHTAIYFFAIEHCNRLGWKEKFGFPSQMVMEALGIKNWRTYSKALKKLVDHGFIKMIEISKNQYSSNIIAIVENTKAHTKALDKALQKHSTKQGQSTVSIDIQETRNKKQDTYTSIITFLNNACSKNYKTDTRKTNDLIKARLNEGFTLEDFKTVIRIKAEEWKGTDNDKYLRPETLFGNKFEGYLNQKPKNGAIVQFDNSDLPDHIIVTYAHRNRRIELDPYYLKTSMEMIAELAGEEKWYFEKYPGGVHPTKAEYQAYYRKHYKTIQNVLPATQE